MGIKSMLARPFAARVAAQVKASVSDPHAAQQRVFDMLIHKAKETAFGMDHGFSSIRNFADFSRQVPLRDYEGLRPYVDRVKSGEPDILWPGKPLYFAKTSGTTSGTKYIPLTKDSIPNHIQSARNALLLYIHETKKTAFVNGKMIFLQGSPVLTDTNGIQTGRLSGIVYHFVPNYLMRNRMPSYEVNCIEDWEEKVEAIVRETANKNMSLISGIPPWVLMYYEKLLEYTGKQHIKDIFPDFSLFVYGGVNYEPYRNKIEEIVGKRIDSIETYPASEGFIAYQDSQHAPGLLLNVNSGIYFEFIPLQHVHDADPPRLSLRDVELDTNYAIVINNNAGLWGYHIGDTVKFVSKDPYRIIVTGRIKHFISAFGEHVIGEEVEYALNKALEHISADVIEFTVAPQVNPPEGGLPYHEWFIEFGKRPEQLELLALEVDKYLQEKNMYYRDLVSGNILRPLKITCVRKDGFREYMRSKGKLGGQNKVARLANDRSIADELKDWTPC
ncbi:MAG: GH3 auxin-responsive promoter family protein [Chitinophagales bacterium]